MRDGDIESGDADDDIQRQLDAREFDENEIDDVPIRLEESAQAYESPVKGTNPDQYGGDFVKNLHMIMQNKITLIMNTFTLLLYQLVKSIPRKLCTSKKAPRLEVAGPFFYLNLKLYNTSIFSF